MLFSVAVSILFFKTAQNPAIFIVPFVVALVLVILVTLYQRKKAKERMVIMQGAASQLGWTFSAEAPWNYIPGLDRFTLFNQGHSKQIKNMMYGEAEGVKAAVFDYNYTTGSGKNSTTYYQSVVYLEPASLDVPNFSLRPEGIMSKVLSVFGYQDIDFGQRPNFSQQYLLRGHYEPAIRQAFNDRVLAFYENYPGTSTDGGGNQLFLFRAGYRFQPPEIQGYVGLGLELTNLFKQY